jgi:hypothetical protein
MSMFTYINTLSDCIDALLSIVLLFNLSLTTGTCTSGAAVLTGTFTGGITVLLTGVFLDDRNPKILLVMLGALSTVLVVADVVALANGLALAGSTSLLTPYTCMNIYVYMCTYIHTYIYIHACKWIDTFISYKYVFKFV